jgi:diguanylate cyclase (GGDEF)-like protein
VKDRADRRAGKSVFHRNTFDIHSEVTMDIWNRLFRGRLSEAADLTAPSVSEPSREEISSDLQLEYERVLDFSHMVHSTLSVDRVLDLVLSAALEMSEMQQGFVCLGDAGEMKYRLGRDESGNVVPETHFEVDRGIVSRTAAARDLQYSSLETRSQSSAVCVPLLSYRSLRAGEEAAKLVGVLYMESAKRIAVGALRAKLIKFLALHGGLALENALLFDLASVEPATQMLSRAAFDQLADSEWKQAIEHSEHLSVLMLDVDFLKDVNRSFGLAEGDRVLQQVAWVVRRSCRHEDLVCRYEDEKTMVLLPETEMAGAATLALRLNMVVPFNVQDPAGKDMTLSIGLSSYAECGASSLQELIQQASEALREAKRGGRNRFCKSPPGPAQK